jgi:hypothetical protein
LLKQILVRTDTEIGGEIADIDNKSTGNEWKSYGGGHYLKVGSEKWIVAVL